MFWDYLKALVWNWRGIVLFALGLLGMVERFLDSRYRLPRWAKYSLALGAFIFANFFAYRDARIENRGQVPIINMFSDSATKDDQGRSDFRFTLRNFGNASAVAHINFVLLLDGRPQTLRIQLPERSVIAPQQQIDINLPLVVTPQTNAAIWDGQSQAEVRITADYSGGEPVISTKYEYVGRFDAYSRDFSTMKSE
jgi:hypothetical protein